MTVLAIDTSLDACAVAVHGAGIAAERREMMARGHAERLPLLARDVMAEAGLAFGQLSRIAVTVGPGTFTGIRIGLAFARGLALALDLPVIGFNTLEAMALGVAQRPLLVVNAARDEEAYVALYRSDTDGDPPRLMALADVAAMAAPVAELHLLGSAAGPAVPGSTVLPFVYPSVSKMAERAMSRPATTMPEPLYLRAANARPQAGYVQRVFIRKAQLEESGILAAIHQQCFDQPWDDASFATLMAGQEAQAFLALEAGNPVGMLLARAVADEAEILTVGVLPPARRNGIGAKLLAMLDGLPRLFIEVACGNTAALALYRRNGFREAGCRKAYYRRNDGRFEDALIMRRDRP